jgi:hypothetical protein
MKLDYLPVSLWPHVSLPNMSTPLDLVIFLTTAYILFIMVTLLPVINVTVTLIFPEQLLLNFE